MKKTIVFILVVCFALSACTVAFAAEPEDTLVYAQEIQQVPVEGDTQAVAEEQEALPTEPVMVEPVEVELEAGAAAEYSYRLQADGTAEITRYNGNEKAVTIPTKIGNYKVTSLGENAFRNTSVESVAIPSGILAIGAGVFEYCQSLRTIKIAESISYIPDRAFYHCNSLNNVVVPKSITALGESAFEGCTSLKNIEFKCADASFGRRVFSYCTTLEKIVLPATNMGWMPVHDDGTREDGIFSHCYSLKEVTLPKKLKYLANNMFYNCSALKTVTLPEELEAVNYNDFMGCTSLESITLPKSVKEISGNAFKDCISLKDVYILGPVKKIEDDAFTNCYNITRIWLPQTLTSISDTAFSGCFLSGNTTVHGVAGSYAEAYAKVKGCKFTAEKASTVTAQPSGLKTKVYPGKRVRLIWKQDNTVDGYYVYRSTTRSGNYKCIKLLGSARSYTDKKVTAGTTYYYKLVPYSISMGKKVKGSSSAVVSARAIN